MWTYSRGHSKRYKYSHYKYSKNKVEKETELKEELLQRFCCPKGNKLQLLTDEGIEIPPYACKFSPGSIKGSNSVCLIADEEGYVSFVDSNTAPQQRTTKVVSTWRCHRNAILDIAWGRESTFATASGDTSAALWDVNSPQKRINVFSGHSCSLKSICFSKFQPNLIATGSRDGNALIWDDRCKNCQRGTTQPCLRIQDAHAIYDALTPQKKRRRKLGFDAKNQLLQDSRQTVTSVLFENDNTLITSGAMDGTIKLWDLRKIKSSKQGSVKTSRGACPAPKEAIIYPGSSSRRRGYTCLLLDSTHTRLFASCTDDTVYEYDLLQESAGCGRVPVHRYTGHYSSSFDVKITLSPDDIFLLSGCDRDKAYIWNTKTRAQAVSPIAYLTSDEGMDQVTSVDWCPTDWSQIVTCSDDCAVRFWRLSSEWPASPCFDGYCKKLPSQNISEIEAEKEEVAALLSVTPVKTPPFPRPPDFNMLTPRQTSLCKWVQQKSNPWRSEKSEETSHCNVIPVKSSPQSTDSNLLTPKQTSLCKWVQQKYSPWSSEKLERMVQLNVTPVKVSPFRRSQDLNILTPKQTLLSKWIRQKTNPWRPAINSAST